MASLALKLVRLADRPVVGKIPGVGAHVGLEPDGSASSVGWSHVGRSSHLG